MWSNESTDGLRLSDAIRQQGHALNTKAQAEYFPFSFLHAYLKFWTRVVHENYITGRACEKMEYCSSPDPSAKNEWGAGSLLQLSWATLKLDINSQLVI